MNADKNQMVPLVSDRKVINIPASELNERAIKVCVVDQDGKTQTVWADTSEELRSLPVHQPEFGPNVCKLLEEIRLAVFEHYPCSAEQCRNNFRCDLNPLTQIAYWLQLTEIYQLATKGMSSTNARKDVYKFLLHCGFTEDFDSTENFRPKSALSAEFFAALKARFQDKAHIERICHVVDEASVADQRNGCQAPKKYTPEELQQLINS